VHVIGGGGGEENHRALQILRHPPATSGDALEDRGRADRVRSQGGGVLRGHVAGRNRVDVDPVFRPLVGQGTRDPGQAALGGGVGRNGDSP